MMFKFWRKPAAPKIISEKEKQDSKNAAIAIKAEIENVLENDVDEAGYDRIYALMASISQDVYHRDYVLSYSLSDARKFLGDIDIREKDKAYDAWWREKLHDYLKEIDGIISK